MKIALFVGGTFTATFLRGNICPVKRKERSPGEATEFRVTGQQKRRWSSERRIVRLLAGRTRPTRGIRCTRVR